MATPMTVKRRYAFSEPFIKTNHIFGDSVTWEPTSYTGDFSCRKLTRRQMSPQHGRLRKPTVDELLNDTTPRLPPVDHKGMNLSAERKKLLQKTNFQFGNDGPERLTAYGQYGREQEGACSFRCSPCSPPQPAELFADTPRRCENNPVRSTTHRDFTYFGPEIAEHAHMVRVDDLDRVKSTIVSDSVAHTLQAAPVRLLTRSMANYRHPADRIGGGRSTLARRTIAPQLRVDSIWMSVNGSLDSWMSNTESRQNYSWPLCDIPIKQFKRGHMQKVR